MNKSLNKILLIGLLVVALCGILLLSSCGDDNGVIIDPNATQNPDSSSLKFKSGDLEIYIYQEIAQVKATLGEPVSYYESASCGYTGMDMFYQYKGFELTVNTIDGKDVVTAIFIADDTVTIPEGLKIGDSEDKIESLLGSSYEKDGRAYNFNAGSTLLQILVKDGAVISIEYKPAN